MPIGLLGLCGKIAQYFDPLGISMPGLGKAYAKFCSVRVLEIINLNDDILIQIFESQYAAAAAADNDEKTGIGRPPQSPLVYSLYQ